MNTLDLSQQDITLPELLKLAAEGTVRVVTQDGQAFIIEDADEFDREVETLGASESFREFLKDRSRQPGTVSLGDYRKSLE